LCSAADGINVYFNQPESSAATSSISNSTIGIDDALVDFIETAVSGDKVYLCFYSSTTQKITNAINTCALTVGAGNIFHITEEGAGGDKAVSDPGIYSFANSIDDGSSTASSEDDLMHNKFAVVINTTSQKGRVWTGSYNPTDNGTVENNNNALWIESYSLAKIYADEFLYMWNGGAGKFSTDKSTSPNTAKAVTVGNDTVEVYFSPYNSSSNTNTSMKIEDFLDAATHSVFFCMFTFSNSETRIKEALKDAYDRGLEVNGVVEATQLTSSETQSALRSYGIDVVLDANDDNMHHKFCVIDYGTDQAKVLTGSYNWTLAANTDNDENFLVIHSPEVAALYWEEFQKNFALSGGGALNTEQEAVSDVLVYPSPAKDTDSVTVGYTISSAVTEVNIIVYTINGEKAASLDPDFYSGTYNEATLELVNSSGNKLAPGLYIIKVEAETADGTFFSTDKFAVIR
jgi:hypothetical protein